VAALATAGYRASRESHHYRVIQSLELTVVKDAKFIRSCDAFRKKRNVSNYDIGEGISDREVQEMSAPSRNPCARMWNTGFVRITRSF
jgi:hypothetical protein